MDKHVLILVMGCRTWSNLEKQNYWFRWDACTFFVLFLPKIPNGIPKSFRYWIIINSKLINTIESFANANRGNRVEDDKSVYMCCSLSIEQAALGRRESLETIENTKFTAHKSFEICAMCEQFVWNWFKIAIPLATTTTPTASASAVIPINSDVTRLVRTLATGINSIDFLSLSLPHPLIYRLRVMCSHSAP